MSKCLFFIFALYFVPIASGGALGYYFMGGRSW
jgi:hypothetical protein